MVQRDRGNYDEAEMLYRQSLAISERLGDQAGIAAGIAATLHGLAMIQQERGNYGEAERLYRQSLTMNERLGDQAGTAFSWGALGRLAEKRGDLNVAAAYYEKALRLFQKTGQRQYEKLAKDDLDRVLSRLRKGIQK